MTWLRHKKRCCSEAVHSHAKPSYSVKYISQIFSLSYCTVLSYLSLFTEKNGHHKFTMEAKFFSVNIPINTINEIKALKVQAIIVWKRNLEQSITLIFEKSSIK